ncbi:hypothetical protein [Nitratifractor sp.]
MRYECTIPLMQAQDPGITSGFGALGKLLPSASESLDELRDFFENAMLDVFPELLPENDPRIGLLDCEFFRFSAERHYLDFIRKVFVENGGVCYWHTKEFYGTDLQNYLYKIKLMDRIDEMIYSRQFEIRKGNTLFKITDVQILEFVIRGFLRELLDGALYFPRRPLMVAYSYDLSLPVLCESAEDLTHYRGMAREAGLYFR